MNATYSVLNRHGTTIARDLDLDEAAREVLTYDGHDYEVRRDEDGGWSLYTTVTSRNASGGHMLQSSIYSFNDDKPTALEEIYRRVIENSAWWSGIVVMTDAEYNEMIAEIERENA